MEKRFENQIKEIAKKFLEVSKDREVLIISHNDTDGISSAAIMIKTLKRLDRRFDVKIVNGLEEQFIYDLPKNKIILFLDLASGCLNYIANSNLKDVFMIDHHEIPEGKKAIPENVNIINSNLYDKQEISASCLTYLFCREIMPENKELAKLAVLGMIGDLLEKKINRLNNEILNDGEVIKKRGLLIYPSTRPLNKTLEFCSNPYIPGISGNTEGVLELLREIGLNSVNGKYPSIIELDREQMEKLITAVMLRNPKAKSEEIIGDIFLIKFFNKLEDARELSTMINACSRLGESHVAISFCLENSQAKKRVETIHAKYKQHIISGLRFASKTAKIEGRGFVIINAKKEIKDTIIGTIASILSNSAIYEEGTIIVAMADYEDKIKISSRTVGRNGRNTREILAKVIQKIGGEVGGHEFAAGAIIKQEKEEEFINFLKKNLEVEVVKI